jgi:intergrase/recombinase
MKKQLSFSQKIWTAIDAERNSRPSYSLAQYEDNYDGFTHSTFQGLFEYIVESLFNDGFDESVSMSIIEDYVYQLFD